MGDELGLDRGRILAVVRPPPEVTLYHRGAGTDLFAATLARLLAAPEVQTVVLPRTEEQRRALARPGRRARAGDRRAEPRGGGGPRRERRGTMNREAAALGVPAYTPFAARLGAVDRLLIAERRLNRLERPEDVALRRRDRGPARRATPRHSWT